MLVPIKWLKDYTKVDVDINEFTDRMIMSGSNLETVEKLPGEMRDVVVGKINKAEKHPLSDRLSLCMVDVGKGEDIKVERRRGNTGSGMPSGRTYPRTSPRPGSR